MNIKKIEDMLFKIGTDKILKKSLNFKIITENEDEEFKLNTSQFISFFKVLITELLKTIEDGGVLIEIKIKNKNLFIKISDTGLGIEEDFFYNNIKNYIQDLNMDIEIQSKKEIGTSINLEIGIEKIKSENGKIILKDWLRKIGGNIRLKELLIKNLKKLPLYIEKIENALDEKRYDDLKKYSHDLKGSSGNFQMYEIYFQAKIIDKELKREDRDILKIKEGISKIKKIQELIPDLSHYEIESEYSCGIVFILDENKRVEELLEAISLKVYLIKSILDFNTDGERKKILLVDLDKIKDETKDFIIREKENIEILAFFSEETDKTFFENLCKRCIKKPIKSREFYRYMKELLLITGGCNEGINS